MVCTQTGRHYDAPANPSLQGILMGQRFEGAALQPSNMHNKLTIMKIIIYKYYQLKASSPTKSRSKY